MCFKIRANFMEETTGAKLFLYSDTLGDKPLEVLKYRLFILGLF